MPFEFLNKRLLSLLDYIYTNGKMTKKESPFIGFYFKIWDLRDMGLVETGNTEQNGTKEWILTEKGKSLIKKIKEIEVLLDGK